ncbi:MAG TPA: hypothetical protein VNE71_15285 [Myxococcota bacterium]|nr:hypothetical protein [Myxococcota bacterium]
MRAPRTVREEPEQASAPFFVFVEGPRDRDVLLAWARRLSTPLYRLLPEAIVILGGRQPARAALHLARAREAAGETTGLCVLDADGVEPEAVQHDGLDVFTWRRRHIESYLLVPAAIERAAGVRDARLRRILQEELPPAGDERAFRTFDAKRFLGPKGPLARLLDRVLPAGEIARAMREEEIHPEIRALCERIAAGLGLAMPAPVPHVTARSSPGEV